MSTWEIILQLLITGLANGLIIALIALGYTMVYGIVELINFAHGDVMMLGCFLALTLVGLLGGEAAMPWLAIGLMLLLVPLFCATARIAVPRRVRLTNHVSTIISGTVINATISSRYVSCTADGSPSRL